MGHSHHHDPSAFDPQSGDRRVSIAILANALLTVAQIIGGLLAGSLALIADALHNFSDMASLLIAFFARKIARRPADEHMTFGYGRIEIVAALVNYTTLIIVGLYLIYEAGMRLVEPPAVEGWTVVILASLALVIDTLTALLTYSLQKGSMNMRALFLHNLSDALASVAVVLGGTLILLYDWRLIDPIVTLLIAGYILYLSITEINGPIRLLMLGSPPELEGSEVVRALQSIKGVARVHHVHLWQMQEHEPALDCPVVVYTKDWSDIEAIKRAIKQMLRDRFAIRHSTLEFENSENAHQDATLFGHPQKRKEDDVA